jgi:hypothetical protein
MAGTHIRESQSVVHLTAYFLNQNLTLVCMTQDVEMGAADAYFESEKDDTFVGCQVTRGTASTSTSIKAFNGSCNIKKTKQQIDDGHRQGPDSDPPAPAVAVSE